MQLTRLMLNPHHPQARWDLAEPYQMHRTLVRAFVRDETQKPPRFLWRLELGALWRNPVVLLQSAHQGDFSPLQAFGDYLKEAPESKSVDLEELLQKGAAYRFRLQANPTVMRNRKRYGLLTETAQLDWLQRQGERHGFKIETALVCAVEKMTSRKKNAAITLQSVCYEGVLRTEDAGLLRRALLEGIGPAKAFGCGLLSLARYRS